MTITKYDLRLVVNENVEVDTLPSYAISAPEDFCRAFSEVFRLEEQAEEVFVVFAVNIAMEITAAFEASRGGLNYCTSAPREIFKRLITANAYGFVVAHNHPSGHCVPSPEDEAVTRRLYAGGELLGLKMIDSLVIASKTRFHSARANGVIREIEFNKQIDSMRGFQF